MGVRMQQTDSDAFGVGSGDLGGNRVDGLAVD